MTYFCEHDKLLLGITHISGQTQMGVHDIPLKSNKDVTSGNKNCPRGRLDLGHTHKHMKVSVGTFVL